MKCCEAAVNGVFLVALGKTQVSRLALLTVLEELYLNHVAALRLTLLDEEISAVLAKGK